MEVEMENGVIHNCGKRILCDAIYIYIYIYASIYISLSGRPNPFNAALISYVFLPKLALETV